jgi:hypothetical protein
LALSRELSVARKQIVTGRCYQTTSGELCRVVEIRDDGDVVFVSLTVNHGQGREVEQMDGRLFADAVVAEVAVSLN